MPRSHDVENENTVPDTASRSGYDSASEMARGRTREAAGKLVDDGSMEQEGAREQADADAREKEILKPWRRAHDEA